MNNTLLEAFLLIIVGMLARLTGLVKEQDNRILSRFVFNITLPFLVFLAMFRQQPTLIYLKISLLTWLLLGIFTAILFFAGRVIIKDTRRLGVFILTAVGGNTAFLGYSVVHSLTGDAGMPIAVVYDQFGNGLFIYTVLLILISNLTHKSLSWKNVITGVLTPPFIALIIGLAFPVSVVLPKFVLNAIELVGNITTPLMMLIVGMNLTKPVKLHSLPLLGTSALIKLMVMPLVMYLFISITGLPAFPQKITILQSAMPSMMTSVVFAQLYDLDESLAAQIVFGTTFVSFFTLPFIWSVL
ncbi:MAG: AEC family transporter [bacterium]